MAGIFGFQRLRLRLPLRTQVILGVGALVGLVAVSVLLAVFLVLHLRDGQRQLHDRGIPYANAIADAALNAKGIANDERGYLMTGDATFTAQIDRRIEAARAAFRTAEDAAFGPAQYRAAVAARVGFERWIDTINGQFSRFRAGDPKGARASALGPGRAMRKRYEASLSDAQALADEAILAGRESADHAASRSLTILVASLIVAIAIGLLVAAWVVRLILHPIYAMLATGGGAVRSVYER
jgi:methyl-accepting chemotaxis protein